MQAQYAFSQVRPDANAETQDCGHHLRSLAGRATVRCNKQLEPLGQCEINETRKDRQAVTSDTACTVAETRLSGP